MITNLNFFQQQIIKIEMIFFEVLFVEKEQIYCHLEIILHLSNNIDEL